MTEPISILHTVPVAADRIPAIGQRMDAARDAGALHPGTVVGYDEGRIHIDAPTGAALDVVIGIIERA